MDDMRGRHSIVTVRTSTINSAVEVVDPDDNHIAFIKRVIFSASGAAGVVTLRYGTGPTTIDVLRVRDGDTIDLDHLGWRAGAASGANKWGQKLEVLIASGPTSANLTVEYYLRART